MTTTTPDFILDSSLKLWHDKIIENYKRKDLTAADLNEEVDFKEGR